MIVPMKKATIFALRADRDALLLALQRSAVMMVTENDGCVRDERAAETEARVQGAGEALSFMSRYREKSKFFTDDEVVGFNELVSDNAQADSLAKQVTEYERQMEQVRSEIAAAENSLTQYEPWLGLEIPLSELDGTKTARVHTGYIPQGTSPRFKELEDEGAYIELFNPQAGSLAALFVCYKDSDEELVNKAKDLGFVESAPPYAGGTAQGEYDNITKQIASAKERLAELGDKAKEAASGITSLELLYDKLNTDLKREETPYALTDSTFYITGWVTAERAGELDGIIKEATDVYDLVVEEPAEGEEPPTLTRNNKFVTPFETLTDMFSRPNPLEGIDPNPAMAPWYWIIFGMMMADFGYGVVMAVLFTLFKMIKKPKGEFGKLVTVLQFGSVTTALWGIAFGSYFGAEWFPPLIFVPLNEPMGMLILCFAIGAIHISWGLAIKGIHLLKAGDWQNALGNCFAWIVAFAGIGMLFLPALANIGKYLALGGAIVVVLFAGSGSKNIVGRIGGGLYALYGITGFMSDIFSYSRIMALMLSSGVVAMVMNMLAGMLQGSVVGFIGSILVYIVGHVFNLAMGLLSAYVHASRLQFVEFFGKFYDGGGYAFKPLATQTRYTVVKTEK